MDRTVYNHSGHVHDIAIEKIRNNYVNVSVNSFKMLCVSFRKVAIHIITR
jgi:hypothetical protein